MSDVDFRSPVTALYPRRDGAERPLKGLYLETDLPDRGRAGPWIYANFVATLDGRIALLNEDSGEQDVPGSIADPRDWRLFQELASRADLLLTSGRYLRDLHAGKAQDILPVSPEPGFQDLHDWRRRQGLAPQPDVAVLSASLDFALPPLLFEQGRRVYVLTTRRAPETAVRRLEADGARLFRLDDGEQVSGRAAVRCLDDLGYRRVYSVTGPYVFHTLLRDNAVDTLFLTWRHRLVGGTGVSIVEGPAFTVPVDLHLRSLYRDTATMSAGQLYARFELGNG